MMCNLWMKESFQEFLLVYIYFNFLFFLIVWQRRSIEGSNQWIKWRSDWTQFHYCEGVCSDSLFSLSLFHGALKLMVDVIRGQLLQHGLWCMRFWFCLAWPPTNVRSNISISHFVVVETSLYVSLTFIPLPRFSCLPNRIILKNK